MKRYELTIQDFGSLYRTSVNAAWSHLPLLIIWTATFYLLVEAAAAFFSESLSAGTVIIGMAVFLLWCFVRAGATGSLEFEMSHAVWTWEAFWRCSLFYFFRIGLINLVKLIMLGFCVILTASLVIPLTSFSLLPFTVIPLTGVLVTTVGLLFAEGVTTVDGSLPIDAMVKSVKIVRDNPVLSFSIAVFLVIAPLAGAALIRFGSSFLPSPWARLLSIAGTLFSGYVLFLSVPATLTCSYPFRRRRTR